MAWASFSTIDISVIAVSFDKTQLSTGSNVKIVELSDDICLEILTGRIPMKSALMHIDIPLVENIIEDRDPTPWDQYPSMLSIVDKQVLAKIVKELPENAVAVEIGSRVGGSAKIILDHAAQSIKLYCIDAEWATTNGENTIQTDPYMSEIKTFFPDIVNYSTTYDFAKYLLHDYNNVILIPASSPDDMQYWEQQVDFVFNDSSYDNPQLHNNIRFWWNRLHYNGIMAGSNYAEQFLNVVNEAHLLSKEEDCYLHIEGHMWWIFKKLKIKNHVTGYGNRYYSSHWEKTLFGGVNPYLVIPRHFFVWDWRITYSSDDFDAFPWDEFNKCREQHPDTRMSVIIDGCLEGADYYNHMKPLCDQLIASGIRPKDILLWAGIEEPYDIPVTNIDTRRGYTLGMREPLPKFDSLTTHHFIMLARNPRPMRLMMADQILTRGLDKYGYMSCGCVPWITDYIDNPYLSKQNSSKFPIILDGQVDVGDQKQYSVSDTRIACAAINVICETSQDVELEGCTLWSSVFITEKTAKAFLLCQFPLMISVPGTVEKLQRHGFDMFDDIIDHSYDTEPDPRRRVDMVADQLERLCHIDDIAGLRSKHWSRLTANRDILTDMLKGIHDLNTAQLEQWLKDTQ